MAESDATKTVRDFFARYRLRTYAEGQTLLLNNEEARYIFYLETGRVKQYDITYKGDEIILNTFKPGAFFPMSVTINHKTSPYIFETETDVELRQAPAAEVVAFLKSSPEVTFDLLARVYRGLDGLLGRLAYLMAGTAKGRLMYELLICAKRYGKPRGDTVELAMNESKLAARAGLARETVSREMKKLADEGLVKVHPGVIFITSFRKFETKLTEVEY